MQKKLLFVYCGSLFLLLFVSFFHPIYAINEDLGRHLLLGEIITQTGSVPTTNLLSYNYSNYPFINSHWLSEVVFYHIVQWGGFNLLLVMTTIVTLISFFLVFRLGTKKYSLAASALAATIVLPILIRRSEVRPEVFSFLFEVLFLYILFSYRSRFTKWIYVLIPLQILWVNMHIYFVAGIILLILFLIESFITNSFRFNRSTKTLAYVLGLSLVGLFLNPNGFNGIVFPLTVLQHYGMPVLENQSVFFVTNLSHILQIAYSVFVIIATLVVLLLNRKKTLLIDWLLVIIFSLLALVAVRNAPLFAYAIYIPLTAGFAIFIPKIFKKVTKIFSENFTKALQIFVVTMLIGLCVFYIFYMSSTRSFGFGVPEKSKSAADFFITNKLRGPIYNDYNTGSYFAYRFYPSEKVFVDGRPEAFPETFFHDVYLPMETDATAFTKALKTYQFNTLIISDSALVPVMQEIVRMLKAQQEYSLVYEDSVNLIFVKKIIKP